MHSLQIMLALALGPSIASIIGPAVTLVRAQSQGPGADMHVCVDSAGVMRMIPLSATCANGRQSFVLKHAGDADIDADHPKGEPVGGTSEIDETILATLDRRLKALEGMNCAAPGKSKVVAPFELKDRKGNRIFAVDQNALGLFNNTGEAVARIVTSAQGAVFVAQSAGAKNTAFFGFSDNVAGLGLKEARQLRVDLGKNSGYGNYRLKFYSAAGTTVAGIGASADNLGLAEVRDQSGKTKATMGVWQSGAGLVEVLSGKAIAQLTEGDQHHGGKLWIGNASGLGMVEAGDAGGYGMVKAGPYGFEFIPTPGLALPGSVIIGKE